MIALAGGSDNTRIVFNVRLPKKLPIADKFAASRKRESMGRELVFAAKGAK